MRAIISFLPGIALTIFNVGWDMIGYQNPTLGFVLWGISALLFLIPVVYWLAVVIIERNHLRERVKGYEQEQRNLQSELHKAHQEHDDLREKVKQLQSEVLELRSRETTQSSGRNGMTLKGGNFKSEGLRIRNQDTSFKSEDTDTDLRDTDIE